MNNSEQKAEIRQRYKGFDKTHIRIIQASERPKVFDDSTDKRVAVYARVSTGDPHQTSSYELQKNYYEDMVNSHPNWTLVNIYADEGISGTSKKKRASFNKMIEDCIAGMIDLILVKNIARFARNTVDCLQTVRDLGSLRSPVGIYFESERIYISGIGDEMALAFLATMAQEESHSKSVAMNGSVEMRFKAGIVLTPALFGYDLDDKHNLIINPQEAPIVKLMFFMYLFGYSSKEIADYLTAEKIPSKKGNTTWSSNSVIAVLKNERHCGDVLARKTFTPNYLDHKPKKNKGERNQYYIDHHHEPIVSREDFLAVQEMIHNSKYGHKGFYPQLNVITSGFLTGYVVINTKWDLFSAEDYIDASAKYHAPVSEVTHINIISSAKLISPYFYNVKRTISITFSYQKINISSYAVECLKEAQVELLIEPLNKILCIRSSSNSNQAVHWAGNATKSTSRTISGTAFLPTVYELMNWNPENKYKVIGYLSDYAGLVFHLEEAALVHYQTQGKPIYAYKFNKTSVSSSIKRSITGIDIQKERRKRIITSHSYVPSSSSVIKDYIDTNLLNK